jgi:2-dehydro-3-deoxyphosphogluconate aldolase / (4S)-4-hydroxy-2-oxoglutarate aldolase
MHTCELMLLAPVIPVIVIDDIRHAVPMARALVAGGIRVLEVTLRTPVALDAVRAIASEVPDAIVGVGTVTHTKHFADAKNAGAKFAVTPGLTRDLARAAMDMVMPLLPGVMTPSDIIAALNEGFTSLKFFPATAAGGTTLLKAFAGPFADVAFCPTGGITLHTAPDFLALNNVKCVGGSWLTPKSLMDAQDWAGIEKLAREASSLRRV